jgi:hypothetical protein
VKCNPVVGTALVAWLVLGALSDLPAGTITPDLYVRNVAASKATRDSQEAADRYLAHARAVEETRILVADLVVLGAIERVSVKELEWGGDVLHSTEVEMRVDECVKGPHLDRITFEAASPSQRPGVRFEEGEQVVVLLNWYDTDWGRQLKALMEEDKYSVDAGGTVVRKGIGVAEFLAEMRELLAPRAPARLYEQAGIVAIGQVVGMEDAPDQDQLPLMTRRRLVSIEISDLLKGPSGTSRVAVVPPAFGTEGFDFVNFDLGERVLVFLGVRSDGCYDVVGGHDGKHRLGDPTTDCVLDAITSGDLTGPR